MIELFTCRRRTDRKSRSCWRDRRAYAIAGNILRGERSAGLSRHQPEQQNPAILDDLRIAWWRKIAVFETGAILIYLRRSTDIPAAGPAERTEVLQWLCSSAAASARCWAKPRSFGAIPRIGFLCDRPVHQRGNLALRRARPSSANREWIRRRRLQHPWISRFSLGLPPSAGRARPLTTSRTKSWLERISARPAVKRGMDVSRTSRLLPRRMMAVSTALWRQGDLPAEVKARAQHA